MSSQEEKSIMDISYIKGLFSRTRKTTLDLVAPLERDDYMVQSTPDTSPPKWHLGHTTWFFDNFILKQYQNNYTPSDPNYDFVFNSYYETVGTYVPKPSRATISRPSLEKVLEYRELTESALLNLIEDEKSKNHGEVLDRTLLGVNHEQQHQELLLMDIKRNFYSSSLRPSYRRKSSASQKPGPVKWLHFDPGVQQIGHNGKGFSFDNEFPRHNELIHPFSIADRPATNGEFLEFIQDGGYEKPELWLSGGWSWRLKNNVRHPLYWEREGDSYSFFTFSGMKPLDPYEPVSHVSYYEADAFARWSGCRLPTETQWEFAASENNSDYQSNHLELRHFRPLIPENSSGPMKGIGNTWEWTSSAYLAYPGYRPLPGSLGEYNGKFMSDQMVLRGASYATPKGHSRPSYRNFYHPASRWQFSGIRLSRDGMDE